MRFDLKAVVDWFRYGPHPERWKEDPETVLKPGVTWRMRRRINDQWQYRPMTEAEAQKARDDWEEEDMKAI